MGIDIDVAKFLVSARERKANFQKTLMLGNQQVHLLDYDYEILGDVYDLGDFPRDKNTAKLFQFLGAEEVSAMDFSDYEGAAILHDLNEPVGDELKEKFTFVLDGGTIEHVFNFPVALRNAMEMTTIGGHLAIIAGGNNFLGHGFYQFSPELFYRALSAENGFRLVRMIAAEVGGRWFEVADPKIIRGRVELVNDKPIYLMVLAEKLERRAIFQTVPQQSDYVEMWNNGETTTETTVAAPSKLKNVLKKNRFVRQTLTGIRQKLAKSQLKNEKSFSNKRVYKLVDK